MYILSTINFQPMAIDNYPYQILMLKFFYEVY
jgi:hypothetical protein